MNSKQSSGYVRTQHSPDVNTSDFISLDEIVTEKPVSQSLYTLIKSDHTSSLQQYHTAVEKSD
jgi:hypothetical protein